MSNVLFGMSLGIILVNLLTGLGILGLMIFGKIKFGPPPNFLWYGNYTGFAIAIIGVIVRILGK